MQPPRAWSSHFTRHMVKTGLAEINRSRSSYLRPDSEIAGDVNRLRNESANFCNTLQTTADLGKIRVATQNLFSATQKVAKSVLDDSKQDGERQRQNLLAGLSKFFQATQWTLEDALLKTLSTAGKQIANDLAKESQRLYDKLRQDGHPGAIPVQYSYLERTPFRRD